MLLSKIKKLDINTKKNFIVLFFLSLIFTAIETLSIGIIVPFINSFVNQDFIKEYIIFEYLLDLFYPENIFNFFLIELSRENKNIIAFTVILVVIYFLKSIFILFYHFFSINFLLGLQKDLSNLLYRHYLKKDYLNFILLRSSTIFRLVIVDTSLFIGGLRAILDLFVAL